ncbi:MAG: hypothetical protein KDA31_09145 [Phycisphaerales bacterium]|nr:hypothetical protein [Phycisphaerales bacterium]
MIRPPATQPLTELCDWAEIQAISSHRKATTQGDIIKIIQPDDLFGTVDNEPEDDAEADESLADDVLGLALKRKELLGKAYPFRITNRALEYLPVLKYTSGSAYLFYLLFCTLDSNNISPDARHQFEIESQYILHEFFGGESFHFGWTIHNSSLGKIKKRISLFCEESKLGWNIRDPLNVSPNSNDIEIDAIVWKVPSDNRGNAFVVLGQCASGHDWPSKILTSARAKLEDCLDATRDGPWITCFCTPFQIPDSKWRESARSHDGMLFDRIRLVLETSWQDTAQYGNLSCKESLKWLREKMTLIEGTNVTVSSLAS